MLGARLIGAGYAVELAEEPRRARELAQAGDVRLAVLAPDDFGAAGADLARRLRDSLGEVILVDGRDEGSLDILERVRSALQPQAEPRAQSRKCCVSRAGISTFRRGRCGGTTGRRYR